MLIASLNLLPGLSGFRLNLFISAIAALEIGIWVAPRLHLATWRAVVWLASLLMPVAYTWTAATGPATPHHCARGSWFLQLLTMGPNDEVMANVMLFVPAGAAAWLWIRPQQRLVALGVALALPLVIEWGQFLMSWLHRTCQLGDIANNMLGAVIGFSLVAGVAYVLDHLRSPELDDP